MKNIAGAIDWNNGTHENVLALHLQHIAAACQRLVILGAPGSGKSTFVKHLALCLAGAQIDDWGRAAGLADLDAWPHGALTPIYVELRRFVASPHFPADVNTQPNTDHLWNYLKADILGADLADYADDLRYDLEQGYAVLILDGLDEVPYPEGQLGQRQRQLSSLCAALNTAYSASRVIVASRPYAYEGWKLPGFETVTITAFEDEHRIALAARLYQAAGLDEEAAQAKAAGPQPTVGGIDPELKDRPLFVTLMATLYLKGDEEGLPTRRGALYRQSILLLLDRWTASKPGVPSLVELLGDKSVNDLYARLAALAYDVHLAFGEQPGTPEIDEALLYKHLKPLGRHAAADLIPYLSENAGVLVSPGQNQERDVFHFAHRAFQEYLAAEEIVRRCAEAELVRSGAAVDHRAVRRCGACRGCWSAMCWLIPSAAPTCGICWTICWTMRVVSYPADDARWWAVWLAAVIAREQGILETDQTAARRAGHPRWSWSIGWWRNIETAQALPPSARAACGLTLGLLGDPRPGRRAAADGLPDVLWCPVTSEPFIYQNEPHPVLPAFQIAQYPITFQPVSGVLDAPDGFADPQWWAGTCRRCRAPHRAG